jgi:hypothetical protein
MPSQRAPPEWVLLASAPVADARVIYKATNIPIPTLVPVSLDLNHDGVNDMTFNLLTSSRGVGLAVNTPEQNGLIGYSTSIGYRVASALKSRIRVGPKGDFQSGGKLGVVMFEHHATISTGKVFQVGPWANVKNRYLGVKFVIKGKKHYGWVRLTTNLRNKDAVITGYAYETIPNKAIIAGMTNGPVEIDSRVKQPNAASLVPPAPRPATLGFLALGALGLSIRGENQWPLSLLCPN